jgi:hypothetical protein
MLNIILNPDDTGRKAFLEELKKFISTEGDEEE